ncbi:MAG: SpoIIE family protein phosphatase [Spirochaetota bacterium]
MKIRYKFFIAFIIIIAITIPVPLYILNRQIKQQHDNIITEGTIRAKQISHAILNMLLLNSGNVSQTSIDANEYISSFKPLFDSGVVCLQVILMTPNPAYNGILLVDIPQGKTLSRIQDKRLLALQQQPAVFFSTNQKTKLLEFTEQTSLANSAIACLTHMVYNESIMLKPVYHNYMVFIVSIAAIIIIAYITALGFSYKFSRPVEVIINALKKFDEGTTSIQIPVINQKDEIGKLAITTQHLLDMVNLEIKALTQTNMELLRLHKLKDAFLANISYEIKIPLESITHLTNSIIHSYSTGDTAAITSSLEMISNSALRLSYMIDDILDFTRLKNNDIILNKKVVDITGVVNFVISILQPVISSKAISIIIDINKEGTHVIADEQRLQQVLLNIIGNAVKYSQKGTISIATQKHNDNTLAIVVQDSGGGFPEQLLHNIDDFGYDSKLEGTPYGGLGLGLVITKKLIELHNGTISIESIPDKGSTVTLSFPYDEAIINKELAATQSYTEYTIRPSDKDEHFPASQFEKSQGFIYIVDDDPVNVKILYDMLTDAGYYVEFSHDESGLFSILHQDKLPDIVLLDTILPGTSAFQVCEKIRKRYSLYELPIIIITSKHRTQEIITAFRIGANDYLSKPINKDELIARITNLIALKKSVEEHNEFVMIKHEIRLAHEIHSSVVVQDIPRIQFMDIAYAYIPTREMGGDFYDVIKIDEEKTGIMIADVTGHGIPAALVCAMLKMAFANNKELAQHPAQLLSTLNKDLSNNIKENYITAAYAFIDTKNKTVTVSSAGHWPPLLIKKNGSIFNNWAKGFPIGWIEDVKYEETITTYSPGDKFLLYTDGILEARNPDNKIFGFEMLVEYINSNYRTEPQAFINGLIHTLYTWGKMNQSDSFNDDVTIILAELS